MTPIPATELPIDLPHPPPRPELYIVIYRYADCPDGWLESGPHTEFSKAETAAQNYAGQGAVDIAVFKLPPAHPAESEPDWKAIAADYAEQLRQIRRRDDAANAAGEGPHAWLVNCPPGHEFDSLVFPDKEGADIRAEQFNDDSPEGESPYAAIPLYAKPQPAQPARDWRSECKVVKRKYGLWDVISPDGKYFLGYRDWLSITRDTDIDTGVYENDDDARSALSIAPCPPGVAQ